MFVCQRRHKTISLAAVVALGSLLAACSNKAPTPEGQFPKLEAYNGNHQDLSQAPPEDGQWAMPAKDYASTRYSGLNDINTGNVQNLKLAWTFDTGVPRG